MARALRIEFPGALYHVINRGVGQMRIFHTDKDRKKFLHFQERVMKQFNWICHAYCLMGIHYHILVETPDPNLSRGMKLLNQLYSQYYNFKYQRSGPVFQGRYKAWLVDKDEQFLENCRYIVNNPIAVCLVQHPSQWQWSSFNATCGNEKSPPYLHTELVLGYFSSSKRKARKMYESFVLAGNDTDSPFHEARNQIFMGSEEFVNEVLKNVQDRSLLQNIPRNQLLADRPGLKELFRGKLNGSNKNRNRQIRAAFEEHQYTLKEIGTFIGLHPDYLSRLLNQMRKR
jgi:REP element-mobilizing transposase RayT